MAYDRISPIGDVRGDLQAALVAWTIASAMSSGPRRPKFRDFVFKWLDEPQDMNALAEQLKAYAAQVGKVE